MKYQRNPSPPLSIPLPIAVGAIAVLWVVASSLDYQDQIDARRAACEARGPGWTVDAKSPNLACIRPPQPACEPVRQHKPSNPGLTAKSKESCNAPS